MNKIYTCISGATSGIGKASAYLFASRNNNLILLGRRKDRLEDISRDISKLYGVEVIIWCIDVRKHEEVKSFFNSLKIENIYIDVLINSAWLAKWYASIEDVIEKDINDMIDTNIKWLLFVSKYAIPYMKEKWKHIFNLGSISGKSSPYAWWATYCWTKAAINIISECMRLEVQNNNIYVTCINPWLVDTEFQLVRAEWNQKKVDEFLEMRLGKGKQLKPEEIALLMYENIGRNIPEITYRHKQ